LIFGSWFRNKEPARLSFWRLLDPPTCRPHEPFEGRAFYRP
jgi:hypothetical protein